MKRIIRWLETKLSRPKSPDTSDEPSDDVPMPDVDPPKDIQEPTKSDEHVATVPNLEILDESPPDTDESTGFNPDDTDTLQKK